MKRISQLLAAFLVATAAASALAATPAGRLGRELLQSGTTCATEIPHCTARRCTTRILGSRETYVCLRCKQGFIPARGIDGRSIVQCGTSSDYVQVLLCLCNPILPASCPVRTALVFLRVKRTAIASVDRTV